MKDAYTNLIDSLNVRGGAVPAYKCDEFYALVEAIFTEEEADLFAKMPFSLASSEQIAGNVGKSTADVTTTLERMADKGLITSRDKESTRFYGAIPLLPGIFEFQFMKGGVSEQDKKLARLFKNYFVKMAEMPRGERKAPGVPFSRVIPVEQEIKNGIEVYPYDVLSEYIQKTEHIAVSTCYCRHHGELLDDPCEKPKEVCMSFGPGAKFVAERGFGRLISKEEATKILDISEEAGLIHCSSNTTDYIDFVCNCCECHCGIVKSLKEQLRNFGSASNYMMAVDEQNCNGCEVCIDRCPMDAIEMKDAVVELSVENCVGCGLCVSACCTDALRMVTRPERHIPPRNHKELMSSMISSMA